MSVPATKLCPSCVAVDQRSEVTRLEVYSTLMGTHQYWDEDGKFHNHDPNTTSTRYSCNRGHTWIEDHRGTCWCGSKGLA